MTNILNEELDLSGYSDEDFIEVFVEYFRPWIKETHGDEVGMYPMSLLVKKYLEEFNDHYELFARSYSGTILSKMARSGEALVKKGIKELPSLNKDFLFTEKFKKAIDHFVSNYNFPDFVKLHLQENTPFNVEAYLTMEFLPMMKYDGSIDKIIRFNQEFINLVTNYLGFEIGSTAHGKLSLITKNPRFIGFDNWYDSFFNKKFKKDIKELPNVKSYLHSVKIKSGNFTICEIVLTFKRNTRWETEENIKSEIINYLEGLGYNKNRLIVKKS
jgi:hypothetical protein